MEEGMVASVTRSECEDKPECCSARATTSATTRVAMSEGDGEPEGQRGGKGDDQMARVAISEGDGRGWKQRLQRLCAFPSDSLCFAPSGWRGMQTVGRGATMRLVVRLNLLSLLNLLSWLNLLNLLDTRLGVDMYSMEWLEYYMGCDVSF